MTIIQLSLFSVFVSGGPADLIEDVIVSHTQEVLDEVFLKGCQAEVHDEK